jgi:curli biogenesis system outer membrane secretion channel CsgG
VNHKLLPLMLLAAFGTVACQSTAPKLGSEEAKTVATGSAGGANANNASSKLEKCDAPYGTIALVENQTSDWYRYLTSEYRLTSTQPVLRLLIQQSNCFIVVDRGRAMANMQQERALQNSGELRDNSSFGKGQMVSADYSLTPEVMISAKGTSGMGGALGAVGGRWGAALGAIAGGIKTNEAATMLMLTDNRSGVQVSAAEGSASNTDFNLGAVLIGSNVGGSLGGYTNTPQGKVIAAAFTDSYNGIVRAIRNYRAQVIPGQALGTGGRLAVDGARPAPAPAPAPVAMAPAPAPAPMVAAAPVQINSVRDAQNRLNQLGYDVGAPDGQMGRKTTEQIRAFQRDRRLPVTGTLDNNTRIELGR